MAPASPTVTLTGTFADIAGNAISAGSVTASLQGYSSDIPRIAGNSILDVTTATATISNGTFTLGPIYGNDVISPGPMITFYQISMPAPNGGTMVKQYRFAGSGTFDLSQVTPLGSTITGSQGPNAITPGVFTAVAHQFLTGLNAQGQFTSAQPSASDISNTVGTGSAVLASGVTGSGNAVLATSPTLTTPTIGAATATSVNKVAITAPTTAATLAFGTDNATVTFQGTDTYVGRATTDTLTNKTLTGSSNPAQSGIVRLAAADTMAFRNAANTADVALSKNGYDQITATGLSNRIIQNFTSTQLLGSNGLPFQSAVSKTVKANSLGANGALLVRLAGAGVTAGSGLINITIQFGGTNKTVLSIPQSLTYNFRLEATIANQNQTGQQLLTWTSQYNAVLSTQTNQTYTIDTTSDQTLAIGATFNNSGDNVTFQNMQVEIMPATTPI